jgi:hypothetical protein
MQVAILTFDGFVALNLLDRLRAACAPGSPVRPSA